MKLMVSQDQRVNLLHVSEKNYVKFFELLYPHIQRMTPALSKRYWLDLATVEEVCCTSILTAIKKWRNARHETCKFSSWFWTHAHCNLKNISRKETIEDLKRIKYFDYAMLNAQGEHVAPLDRLAHTYGLQQVMTSAMKVPEFKELLNYIYFFFGEHAKNPISKALKTLAKKHRKSLYWAYLRLEKLKVFLQSECEYQEVDVAIPKLDMPSTLVCTKCGETKSIKDGRATKLLRQYGSVSAIHKYFRCRDCAPKAEKRYIDYSIRKRTDVEEEGGDDNV